jgi:hypothetical protein
MEDCKAHYQSQAQRPAQLIPDVSPNAFRIHKKQLLYVWANRHLQNTAFAVSEHIVRFFDLLQPVFVGE